MRAFVLVALIGRVATAQGVELSRVTVTSASEVQLDLERPAFVTVLRIWPDTTAELVYPFDPLQSPFIAAPPVTHQLRFGAGRRHVFLSVPADYSLANVRRVDTRGPGATGYDKHCLLRQMAHLAASSGRPTPRFAWENPEAMRGSWVCQGSNLPTYVTTREWRPRTAPEQLGAHRVVVIVSEQRLDLAALSRAAASLAVADVDEPLRRVLASQRGSWAAYVASVD